MVEGDFGVYHEAFMVCRNGVNEGRIATNFFESDDADEGDCD